ncbi:hypothetical protein BDR04DRAFT_1155231 [Suillus decipiens]|nr:hypothetical protein BDR04DRAFT_1155231 [Suillus decipiens]
MSITLIGVEISTFPTVVAVVAIFFPAMEPPFWISVGSGKEKDYLRIYGDIHGWIIVKLGKLGNVLIVLEWVKSSIDIAKQVLGWVGGGLDVVKQVVERLPEVLAAIGDRFPRKPPQQPEETAGMYSPPYPSDFISRTSFEVTMTVQATAKV